MHLTAIQVGSPRTYEIDASGRPLKRPWTTAIFKTPVVGPVWAGTLGLTGDRPHDTRFHGGPWRAMLMYSAEHYAAWQRELGRSDLSAGTFGENLTVSGLDETTVCLGDILGMEGVRVAVTSPRGPCNTLARRLGDPSIIDRVLENHRSGWYLKVHEEGWLETGMEVRLLERPHPEWTVARAAEAHRRRRSAPAEAALLAGLPGLMPEWREALLTAVSGER